MQRKEGATLNKKERVDAALQGERVDRVPASMWGHDFEREWDAQLLAEAMVENFTRYDWDWMKVNPRASYHVEGWGVKTDHGKGGPNDHPRVVEYPIESAADWGKLRPLSTSEGALDEQIEVIERIGEALAGETYFVQTVFNPLSIAADMVADEQQILADMQNNPQALKAALEVITETFANFARECIKAGASGTFFAT